MLEYNTIHMIEGHTWDTYFHIYCDKSVRYIRNEERGSRTRNEDPERGTRIRYEERESGTRNEIPYHLVEIV